MRTLLWIVLCLLGLLILLVLAALVRTVLAGLKRSDWTPKREPEREALYSQKLSRMVRCETVSRPGEDQREKFLAFHARLEALFPLVHGTLEKTEIDGNLLFFWKGKSSERPVVLMSHQDVVPAEGEWLHGPFSGDIEDGRIWGRGSADTKCSVMAFFQAVEELLAEGFVPEQDVYLSSSCTEETGGDGCPKLVAELKRRGVKPYLVCDEGGAIVREPIGGVRGHFAMIGVLEKGQGNLLLSARSGGGHSSYPPKNSPIARLAAFVRDAEKHSPMRSAFEPEVEAMFRTLAPYGPFAYRLLFGNLWLFRPLLKVLLPAVSPQAAALLRTTMAFTMQSGSDAANVMPQKATVTVNLRYIPHQGMEASNEAVRAMAKKHGVEVDVLNAYDALPPVSIHSDAYRLVVSAVEEVFPGLPPCPYVMTGGTDARFYQEICDACIRFSPVVYGPDQMKGMHGLNEYIDTFSLPGAVDFYKAVIRRSR
ncbi:MAG: M20/M25/M40 family metallo-hydrolase [Oscillospiraceae bacterium]|nr:M20/M25/M40 family metallo-hydrolase [Oscillospiraceae bacterium]